MQPPDENICAAWAYKRIEGLMSKTAFRLEEFFAPSILDEITEVRVNRPGLVDEPAELPAALSEAGMCQAIR